MDNAWFAAGLSKHAREEREQRRRSLTFPDQPHYSEDQLRDKIRSFMIQNGRRPIERDFGGSMLPMSAKTIRRRLGSLVDTCSAIESDLGYAWG